MNVDTIIKYTEFPESMPPEVSCDLKKILDDYPYFQTAHLLYIKNLYQHKNIRYPDQLKIAATYVGNRNILFKLIKKDKNNTPSKKIIHIEKEVLVDTSNNNFEDKQEDKFKDQTTENNTIQKREQVIIESETLQTTSIQKTTENESSSNQIEIDNKLEQHTKEELETIIQQRLNEIKTEENNNSTDIEITETENNDKVVLNTDEKINDFDIDLLDFDYNIYIEENSKEEKLRNKLEYEQTDIQPQFIDYLYNFDDLDSDKKEELPVKKEIKAQISLIDKFLEKNPRLTARSMEEEVQNIDISEDSVKEKEFMSETLANIYIKQKKYDAAIKIYQKLCLKYPQKNTYFAKQIEELKKILNNN